VEDPIEFGGHFATQVLPAFCPLASPSFLTFFFWALCALVHRSQCSSGSLYRARAPSPATSEKKQANKPSPSPPPPPPAIILAEIAAPVPGRPSWPISSDPPPPLPGPRGFDYGALEAQRARRQSAACVLLLDYTRYCLLEAGCPGGPARGRQKKNRGPPWWVGGSEYEKGLESDLFF
jgi:hypothetical protein